MGPIEEVMNNKWLEEIANNIGVTLDLKQDFIQEIYLILLQYDQSKLEQLMIDNKLKWFVIKICTNQYNSKSSPFYTRYKKYPERAEEITTLLEETTPDE